MKSGQKQKGFTIVELLIVIVVIAILAAITIVAFNGVQQRARASAASASLASGKKKLELYKAENGTYPLTGSLASAGVTDGDTAFQYTSDGVTYCLTGTNGSVSYKVTENGSPASGGCAGHAQGGVAAVTNLVTNPSFAVSTSGWTGSSATISRVTSPWVLDNGSIQVTPTAQDSFAYTDIPAVAGRSYTVLGTVRIETPQTGTFQGTTQQRNIFFEFRNSTGGYTGSGNGTTAVQANANGTYSHRGVGLAPANTTTLRVRLYNGATTGGGSVYWDRIMAVEGNYTGSYADGDSADWTWNGTANAATSTGPGR